MHANTDSRGGAVRGRAGKRVLKALLPLALTPALSGCFAVFIPGSVIDAALGAPKYCVRPGAKLGDTFTSPTGETRRITRLTGDSPYFCRNNPEWRRFGVDGEVVAGGAP